MQIGIQKGKRINIAVNDRIMSMRRFKKSLYIGVMIFFKIIAFSSPLIIVEGMSLRKSEKGDGVTGRLRERAS